MRLSLNWLKDYVDIDMSPDDLAHLLTMSGLEVEGLESVGQSLQNIVVATILSVKQHPLANQLSICSMDTGNGEIPVVCSAPNLDAGSLVAMALPGARLPGGTVVQEAIIREEHSAGMLLAEDEMALTDDHSGIMILPEGLKPGIPITSALPLEDYAIEIGLTPNRPDCASIIGIAREIAALTGNQLKIPEVRIEESDTLVDNLTSITIDDTVGCPRYAAGMIQGINLKASPFSMRYRLHISGIRSINNVVDTTNYVMLEMGQPLHAFDYDRLKENRIVVRRAEEGESFTTLDDKTHFLNSENLMICDGERAVALAGIMGGLNSEIFAGSKNVLIESAYFDPVTIRRGSKRLGLTTEASYRFERGMDIEGPLWALQRAMMLISMLAGGKVVRGIIDNYPKPFTPPVIDLRVSATNRYLGTSISRKTMAGYMKSLEMAVHDEGDDLIRVSPPTFRVDITREVDLMEEIARMEGYDNIPVTYPTIRPSDEDETHELLLHDRVMEIMAGLSFTEVITYSFISPDSPDLLDEKKNSPLRSFVKLLNPLTLDQSVMRTSLIPGLLATVKLNMSHGEKDLKLFEWGKVFINNNTDELPYEKSSLAGIITGLTNPKEWYRDERTADFYDIKGAVEVLLKALGLNDCQFKKGVGTGCFDPKLSCRILFKDSVIGSAGRISSIVLERYDLKNENAYLFELEIEPLLKLMQVRKKYEPFTKYPAVYRDISIIVNREIESAVIREVIEKRGEDLVKSVELFDLYEGGKLNTSEKALALKICYRSRKNTLDGHEINLLHEDIIARIIKVTGGRQREG